jgi:hypothetical protein
MATNSSAPVAADIWHLSIDDLLSPLPEKPRLGGPGPFVINLSSSTACIGLPNLDLGGCESAHAYEIQRNEDGRTRYRLRLGPFESEEEADLILSVVREIYPGALTATAGPDDLKSIAAIRAKAAAAADARRVSAPPMNPEPPIITTRAEPIAAPEPPTISARVDIPVQSVAAKVIEPPVITERVEIKAATKPPAAPVATPNVHAAAGKPSMSVSAPLVRRPAAPAAPVQAPRTAAAPKPAAPVQAAPTPWFVIELARSEEAFDPDTVPNLDIFAEYRLYSVAEVGNTRIVHALRVGFFSAEIAAKAVASYLAQYYDKPSIKRVSVAERERFAEQAVEARKDVGATGRHAVIEITDDLVARRKRLNAQAALPPP